MLTYPDIDPVAVSLGPLRVHWYGLMYLVGFAGGWWLGRIRASRPGSGWRAGDVDDLLFYAALGVVVGGRIGYTLFYNLPAFLSNPLVLLKIWEGGMSFHGGLLGVLVAMGLYARGRQRRFFAVADFIAPLVPIGLGAGRLGNFINGELWGKVSTFPWAMRLPCADPRFAGFCSDLPVGALYSPPVHPSQLYEGLLEGVALFVILWLYSSRPRPTMAVSGLFLIFYGVFRFTVEFVRLPDAHIDYLAFGWLTMGQLLTVPMLLFGLLFLWLAYRNGGGQRS